MAEYFETFFDFFFFELQSDDVFANDKETSTFEATLISVFLDLNTVAMAPKKSKNDAQSIGAKVRSATVSKRRWLYFFTMCT